MQSAPEPLLLSAEKLMLDVTENLDPYVALKLAGIVKGLVEVAWIMGTQDGRKCNTQLKVTE